MDPINQPALTPRSKSKLARTFAKVLHIRAATNLDNNYKVHKAKSHDKQNNDKPNNDKPIINEDIEKLEYRAAMDAFIAKLFATLSSVKATYAELQYAQSPYNPEGIQSADQIIVSELKRLSELKQSYLKNHLDYSSGTTVLLSEIQEQKNLVKTYDITKKKLVEQSRVKESEIALLKQKLEEMERENKLIERRLNSSGPLSRHENLQFSKLSLTDFVAFLKHATKSVRSFVKLMVTEMEHANWDISSAAASIHPDAVYWKETHRCFAFESFVCQQMFNGFAHPSFSNSGQRKTVKRKELLFDRLMELRYLKAREYITWKPTSSFAKFCWNKYLQLVHTKMEISFFGNLNQRNLVSVGKFPETTFFEAFAEMAKRVWLLHCLVFSMGLTEVSVFQARKGSRFSEVFMESVNEEAFLSPESGRTVVFTVVPGFKLGKSVVQCQVYVG